MRLLGLRCSLAIVWWIRAMCTTMRQRLINTAKNPQKKYLLNTAEVSQQDVCKIIVGSVNSAISGGVMIEQDEEFYRKAIGIMGQFKNDAVKLQISGEKILIFTNGKRTKIDISISLFYKMKGNEIVKMIKESGYVTR